MWGGGPTGQWPIGPNGRGRAPARRGELGARAPGRQQATARPAAGGGSGEATAGRRRGGAAAVEGGKGAQRRGLN